MPLLNDKPVRLLMHDMAKSLGLQPGQTFTRQQAIQWFREHYPNVKEGTVGLHLMRLSTNIVKRHQYSPRDDGSDDLFFKIDSSHFRLYEPGKDPTPVSGQVPPPPEEVEAEAVAAEPEASGEFAYEHDLRDYLAGNLHLIEPSLRLHVDEGIRGIEFPVGGRFIDILARDETGGYVVIELKVSRGYDRVVGQLLRYMGWIRAHQADPGQKVRGVIVANSITDDLLLACKGLPDVDLLQYQLQVQLQRVAA